MSDAVPSNDSSVKSAVIAILIISAGAFGFLLWLLYFRGAPQTPNPDALNFLPAVNAGLNALSATCIVAAYIAIKSGRKKTHISLMITAIVLSAAFLVSYITYHSIHGDTTFATQGAIRYVYFGILISHVLCTVFALPLIISSVYFAATKRFDLHKKVTKYTVPVWLYVSLTGVAIYFLLKANS